MFIQKRRRVRVIVLTMSLYVLVQVGAQIAMELRFPMAIKFGPVTAVLFVESGWL